MKIFHLLCILLFTGLINISCTNESKQPNAMIRHAAIIMEQHPDSALLLLDSISQPESLPTNLYMEYELRKIQAKDKAYQDITGDTTVFKVAQYFLQTKNMDKAALAELYCGRVYHEQKKYDEATKSYLRAGGYAQGITNENTKGLISYFLGEVHYATYAMPEAINYYKQSYQQLGKVGRYTSEVAALISIGNCFLFTEEPDSALFYYAKGLLLAEKHQNAYLQSTLHQNIGLVYRQTGDLATAKAYFEQAVVLGTPKEHQIMLYRNLANSFYNFGQRDSAAFYAKKILSLHAVDSTTIAPIEVANVHELLALLEEQVGHHKNALSHYRQHADYLFDALQKQMTTSVLEIQKKYDVEKVQNAHNRRMIKYQWGAIMLLGLLLIVTILGLFFRKRYQHTKKQLQSKEQEMDMLIQKSLAEEAKAKEQLVKLHSNIETSEKTLAEQAKSSKAKEKMLKSIMQQRITTIREATLWKWSLSTDAREQHREALLKFNQAVYGKTRGDDWNMFYNAMNELYNGRLRKLQLQISQLDDDEFRICILICTHADESEIATVTGLSNRMVRHKKSSIRSKLGISEYGNIFNTLQQLYKV